MKPNKFPNPHDQVQFNLRQCSRLLHFRNACMETMWQCDDIESDVYIYAHSQFTRAGELVDAFIERNQYLITSSSPAEFCGMYNKPRP